jgi:hypothetical protein
MHLVLEVMSASCGIRGKVVKPRMFLLGWVRRIRVIGISIVASLLLAPGAWAQVTFTVNTTDDGVDDNPGNGLCHTLAGTCT